MASRGLVMLKLARLKNRKATQPKCEVPSSAACALLHTPHPTAAITNPDEEAAALPAPAAMTVTVPTTSKGTKPTCEVPSSAASSLLHMSHPTETMNQGQVALPAPATLNEAIPATGSIELSKTQTESCARALPLVVALTRSKRVASTMWVTPVFQPSMDVPSDVQEAALPSVTDSPSSFVPTDEETVASPTPAETVASTTWVPPAFKPATDVLSDVQAAALPTVTDSTSPRCVPQAFKLAIDVPSVLDINVPVTDAEVTALPLLPASTSLVSKKASCRKQLFPSAPAFSFTNAGLPSSSHAPAAQYEDQDFDMQSLSDESDTIFDDIMICPSAETAINDMLMSCISGDIERPNIMPVTGNIDQILIHVPVEEDEVMAEDPQGDIDQIPIPIEEDEVMAEAPKAKKRSRTSFEKKETNRGKHPMLPVCQCSKKCPELIPEIQRQAIWNNFWDLQYNRQRDWLVQNVDRIQKRSVTNTAKHSRRSNTLVWRLGANVVCKTFFLHTLGYRSDKLVLTALNNIRNDGDVIVGTTGDKRGHHEPKNKLSQEYHDKVVTHINSYRPQVSHYKRQHAPNRRYLPSELSITLMYNHFKDSLTEGEVVCSYTYYFGVFQSMNISFAQPENDLCKKCMEHNHTHSELEHSCTTCDCAACSGFQKHKNDAEQARQALHLDTKKMEEHNKVIVATVDMQKAITIPKVPTKDHFFSRKLVVFNETFACPGKDGQATCVLWHEAEAGRKAFNVCSSYVAFIKQNRDKEEIILYADNCSSQNKNWTLLSAMPRIVNDPSVGAQSITIKYFEPGHTFMAADAVHGNIATKMNRQTAIYDFTDIVDIINNSRKNMKCALIDHSSMYLFENRAKKVNLVLKDLKVIQFRRGSLSMHIKESHEENCVFKEIKLLKKAEVREIENKLSRNENPLTSVPRMEAPRGVALSKKEEILKLTTTMPIYKKEFFENMVVTEEAVDLETSREE
ncbi:uncharacterized protein LOC117305910 isoform X2 [Asterias rubens]|uniref:uncharacterized protein LOC117291576 isoform X2 n=1 Tax=Asterias rubens TaxID=7604 RepID=UPI00145514B0|nr:uncharacterized protein LOC117291576 isoform X2 [Asterias rubens]XP_033646690.1 uncharacterized protein LOC117305910 isoform X2 [Asterias rubens]